MLAAVFLLEVIHFASAGDATVDYTSASSAYTIRPGWSFKVEVFGTDFDTINDKILLVPNGVACGDVATPPRGKYSTVSDYYDLVCDGQGSAATRLVCEDLSVYQAGTYTICVCDATALSQPGPPSAGAGADNNASGPTTTMMTSTSTATSSACIVEERFWLGSVGTGTVTVNGPRNEGTLVKRAGTPFKLILQGTSLSSRDRIRIVEGSTDCYDLTAAKPMDPAVATDVPYTDPSGQRFSGYDTQEIWENIGITVPGTYQVCWCSAGGTVTNDCSDDQEFTTNVATLEVGGPTAGVIQTFECITGVACTLPITGAGLNDRDRIVIIADTRECGFAGQSSAVVAGGEFASPRTSGSDSVSRFGGVIMGRHGNFKVCWCGSYDEIQCPNCCTQMEHFTVYAGNITSGGPIQGQVDRPPVGVPFAYTMTGWGMSSNDRIRIVDKNVICGQAGAEVHSLGIEASTVPNGPPTYTEGVDTNNRTSASWIDIVAREMRTYRVCWCAHFYMGCTAGAHFALDIGIINPRGASNSTSINAIPGRPFSITVNAAPGSFLTGDDRIRIVRAEVSDGKCGGFGTSDHSPAVASVACWPTCLDSPVWGAPEMGPNNESEIWDPVLIMESGTYNICWCNSGQGGCNSDEDFSFRAGVIVASGVNIGQHWHCAAYFPCTVQVPMTDGLAGGDYVQLVPAAPGARCGTDDRAAATSFTRGTRIRGYSGRDSDGDEAVFFEFGSPQAPGVYLACYCQGTICATSSVTDLDFFQQAGQVTVMGLQGRDDYHKCYLRGECKLNIRGAGLDVQDALMLLDPMDNCGQTGSPVSFSVDGPRFFTSAGDRLFIGNLTATSNEGLESWTFSLGTPVRTGRYRLCFCSRGRASSGMCESRSDFDQAAGELFIRGSEFNSERRCEQGEPCQVTARGAQFDSLDRMVLLKDGVGHTCGMVNSGQYPDWASPMTPENIQPDAIIPDLYAATWIIASVREPGTYRICYCAYIIGGTPCVESGQLTPYERYKHELGTVKVSGSILAVREVGVTAGHWEPKLPAAKYAVSVEVDVQTTFMKYTCVATTLAAPDGFIPRKSDLENCTKDISELSDRQRLFPRCWGIGTTVETVTEMGPNVVHVPTFIPDSSLQSATHMHVWCYGRELCSNERCVMPADNVGLAVPLTGGLVSYSTNWAATVSTEFALRVPVASDFDIGDPWPRMKIITHGSECDTTQLHRNVLGITCLESGVGMCEPAPVSTLSSGSWGSGRELMWTGVAVTRADKFTVCYCDRHYASTCVAWISIGELQVKGPQNAGNHRFVVNPGEPGTITINGIGLATEDRIRIIPQNVGCVPLTVDSTTPAGGSRLLQNTIDFRSGSAISANGTQEQWEVLISVEGTYNVCWCGGAESSCSAAEDYTVYLGTMSVATRRDCEVTDWWVVTECTKPCGGGEVKMRRAILTEASGGGAACPNLNDLVKTEQCNMNPCPLARLDRLTTSPAKVNAGSPFQITIQGEWLDPDADRIVLIDQDEVCGEVQAHHGGAACNQFDSSSYALVCGNGASSIRVQNPGWYRVCVCDASASIQRSFDGTTNITTGSVESAGIMGNNCDTPSLYILNPGEGAVIEVFEAIVPQVEAASPDGETFSTGVLVAMIAGGLFTFVVLGLVSAYWVRKKFFTMKPSQVSNADMMAAKEGKEGMQAAVDPHMLQYYESYYQSLGYPPGTATQVLGGANAQHQMALPAPMMPGAMMQAAPPGTPALQDTSGAWMQQRQMALPLALPPSRHPGMMAPPTPQNRGRSPRGNDGGKSFGDLVSENNRRPSRQLPLFTDTSLPRMPTPTATPRGVATPRAGEEVALALEDGGAEEGAGDEVEATASKSLEDVKEVHRPSTADSVLSCLSDSSAGSSRPTTGDTAKPSDAEGKALSPVKEEREEEDKEGGKDSQTPRSFRTFFNDRVNKLLSNKEDTEPDRKLFGASFSGFFGGQESAASAAVSKEVPPEAEPQSKEADELATAAEAAEAEKAAAAEAERLEAERLEAERVAAEQEAAAKAAAAAAEKAAAEKAEAERLEAERVTRVAAEAAEAERQERQEAARRAAEQEAARAAAEKAEAERLEAERLAAESVRAEAARVAAAEAARLEAERLAAEKAAAEREAAELLEAQRAAERAAAEKAAAEKAEAERLEAERLAVEKAAADKEAEEKAQRVQNLWTTSGMASLVGAGSSAFEAPSTPTIGSARGEASPSERSGVSPRTGRAPPPPPPKASGAEASRSGSKESERRPPPPPPKGKPAARPGPSLSVDTDPDATAGSASASPAAWQRADHSLAGLWQSHTPNGSAAPSPLAAMASAEGDEQLQGRLESPAGSAPNTERMMGRPPRGPGPMMPGPGLNVETDFEDTLKSNVSMGSDSPSNRRTHSLGGLAAASANVVAADKKAGKVGTPQHSARSSASRPIRATVPTRSPRKEEMQAQEKLLGHTLPPQ